MDLQLRREGRDRHRRHQGHRARGASRRWLAEGARVAFCARNADRGREGRGERADRRRTHGRGHRPRRRRRRRRSPRGSPRPPRQFGRAGRGRRERQSALAIGVGRGQTGRPRFEVDLMHTVRHVRGRDRRTSTASKGVGGGGVVGVRPRDRLRQGRVRHDEGCGRCTTSQGLAFQLAPSDGARANVRLPRQHLLPRRRVGRHRGRQPRRSSRPRSGLNPTGRMAASPRRSPTP